MGRHKPKSEAAKNEAFYTKSALAENEIAATTEHNKNQKGQIPNKPSTG
ncbi:hypothetical protein [Paenibacillus soyae]|uniref:Uncharacterized protein n=1 Tax=Paenibacillus soyae TaxID=2969249 RepID=A0A9X2MM74_9BACL|nr:hypothetical protein [Paenibacillus soyae]MCR2802825.1 hypothetical protein [Paenibacillus soyae]